MKQAQRLANLDLVRAIAVISVIASHIFQGENSWMEQRYSLWSNPVVLALRAPITTGGFGVALFFLLSGFLIARVVAHETIKTFVIRRFFRIWPLYLLALLARYFVFLIEVDSPDWKLPPAHIVGLLSLFGDFWNTPLFLGQADWSLRIEVLAYLIVVVAMALVRKRHICLFLTIIASALADYSFCAFHSRICEHSPTTFCRRVLP